MLPDIPYAFLLSYANLGLIVRDEHAFLYSNEVIAEFYGINPSSMKELLKQVLPRDRQPIEELVESVRLQESYQYYCRNLDGTEFLHRGIFCSNLYYEIVSLCGPQTKPSHYESLPEDQTIRWMLESIPGTFFCSKLDENWTMEWMTPGVEQLTGYTWAEFTDNQVRPFASVVYPEDKDRSFQAITDATLDLHAFDQQYRIHHREGTTRWISGFFRPFLTPAGDARLGGVMLDGTELRQNQALVELLFDHTQHGLLLINTEEAILRWNGTFIAMWTIPRIIQDTTDIHALTRYLFSALHPQTPFFMARDSDGSDTSILHLKDDRYFSLRIVPYECDGVLLGRIVMYTDISKDVEVSSGNVGFSTMPALVQVDNLAVV